MFYKKSIENKIRFKALLLYAILAVACVVMAVSVWELQQDMQSQKAYVADHYQTLSLTNRILTSVEEAQSAANKRSVGRKRKAFHQKLEEISLMIDSLNTLGNQSFKKEMGEEMISLLNEKAVIVNRLHNLFKRTNPVDPIREKLLEVQPVLDKDTIRDTIQITTVIQDTTIRQAPKRKFWRRFADLFAPPASNDTIIQSITYQADTLVAAQEEAKAILTDVRYFAEDASQNYERRMTDIAGQIGSLMDADQAISARLSELLIQLYQSSVGSTMVEIGKSEARIGEYYRYLTIGAVCFLALILVFILLILQDVNRGREARSELQKSNDRIRQLMESRHQMLLSVSHDIKSPLNSILGYLELWKDEADKPQSDIRSMRNSGNHILSLLENLLEFSALEQGKLSLSCQPLDVKQTLSDVTRMFEPLCRRKNLLLNVDIDIPDDFCINSDGLKLRQLLINLLSNAVKYTSVGEVALSASIRAGFLRIEVRDTGAGIPKEKTDTLFLPFERITENNALADGAGLGLFVVKGLLELFRGEIHVESEVGEGTIFLLLLPFQRVQEEKKEDRSRHIVVVDDDPVLLTLTRQMLEKLGHRASVCSSVEDFDRLMNEKNDEIDSVLTDMEMNTFSGREILKRTRRISPDLPVVIMTGRSDYHAGIADIQGFSSFVPKPFTIDMLRKEFGGLATPFYRLSQLSEMFDDDQEAIREVIGMFCEATADNIALLRETVGNDDFAAAGALCHKMLPMFAQLQADDAAELLRKMDMSRGEVYEGWKADVTAIIDRATVLIKVLSEKEAKTIEE